MAVLREIRVDDSKLLTAAIEKIAEFWGITDTKLGTVMGLQHSTIKRLRLGKAELEMATESFEVSRNLLHLFRSVEQMFGGDDVSTRAWLSTYNVDLAARPIDLIETCKGLTAVSNYVGGYLDRG